jgi:hypothetical protein
MDELKEANERRRMAALPAAHFQPLLDLLPKLRGKLPKPPPSLRTEPVGTLSHVPINVEPLDDLIQLCHALDLVVPFDRNAFVQEHPFHQPHELIDGFDRIEYCQALTALVRGERFTDGPVDAQWRKGSLARLVERSGEVVQAYLLSTGVKRIVNDPTGSAG